MAELELFTFFCDDTRDEVGGKTSYMGMLADRVVYPSTIKRVKGIVAVGMIRVDGLEKVEAQLEVFVPGRDDPLVMPLEVERPEDEGSSWTIHMHAAMNNIPVQDGFELRSVLSCMGKVATAKVVQSLRGAVPE